MVAWGPYEPTVVAGGFYFLEGPRWHDGRLHVSDFYGRQVYAINSDGARETLCTVEHQPSGLGFTPDGDLLIVSMLDRKLLRRHAGNLTEVADLTGFTSGPANDMLVDPLGRAYIGNFGTADDNGVFAPTNLVLVHPDGATDVAAPDLTFPNGAVLAESGTRLLISETFANRITEFAVAADGSLSHRRIWADFAADGPILTTSISEPGTPVQPDGLAIDCEGAVWVSDAKGSGILRVIEGGTVVDAIPTGGLAVFAATFGGNDLRTLYLCAAPPLGLEDPAEAPHGVLMSCRVDVPGAA